MTEKAATSETHAEHELIQTFKDIPRKDLFVGGTGMCAGCGAQLGLKYVLKALGKNTMIVNASGCLTLMPLYPNTPFKVPWLHLAIENAGAAASGIRHALRAAEKPVKGKKGVAIHPEHEKIQVVCYAGDGATYDIGLQSLSSALHRGDDFIYICYNNESFSNTGVQQSSATSHSAYTTTTPLGNPLYAKAMTKIAASHGIPYVATANVAYPLDFIAKLQKAAKMPGPKFIDLLTPCPTGWGFEGDNTIEVGRMATETGLWPLFEIEKQNDKQRFILTLKPTHLRPVSNYFSMQRRFKHLTPQKTEEIQSAINKRWLALCKGDFWNS